ncbi:SMI1/KNR4 family protein [Corynebacterium freiburgense]|uniref:SMI1/KNR4 family protein n=1 Tax=Corynebacterium freiburgense TaxID=556548 RepID=UPI000429F67C|nr:SMI1/KNR4 family protein [Corynebacterium freiburgense]WJZ01805.1 SMI1 / KNR4 family protein [Corynebacterium freiburgense]
MHDHKKRIRRAESNLGCRLPSDYRDFLLDKSNADTKIWGFFYGEPLVPTDWSQDFPFTPEKTFEASTPELFWKRQETVNSEAELEALQKDLYAYIRHEWELPATRGIAFLADEGCIEHTILVLRGAAAGQVWMYNINTDCAILRPRLHPITSQPLSFQDWLDLQADPFRLSIARRKDLPDMITFPKISSEGKQAMRYCIATNTLRGMTLSDIAKLKRNNDIPADAEFLDPHSQSWHPVRNAQVFSWAQGRLT